MSLRRFFRRRAWDDERARELQAYIDHEIDDNVARGMTREQARAAAHRKLGNPTLIREDIYTMNSLGWLETLWMDLRYGARLLRRNPTFTIVAVLTLALGTGANTAIFQLVDALRLRTLPVANPDTLAEVRIVKAPAGRTGMFNGRWPMLSYPLYNEIRNRQQVFTDLAAWGTATFDLATGGETRPAQAIWVSGNFFPLLGVRAAAGRLFVPADDVKGCSSPGVVLGHAFWQREFGGDRSVVGRSMLLEGHRFDITGVASAEFFGVDVGRTFDVAVPICAEPIFRTARTGLERSDVWFLAAIGRLKPGVTVEQASAHLAGLSSVIQSATVSPRYSARDAKDYLAMEIGVLPASGGVSGLRRTYSDSLNILLAVTALVLFIACANLANLMLARAAARQREVAVRLAIGASRRRIVRQMLSESFVIAALGAACGVVAAQWFGRALVVFLGSEDSPLFVDLSLDWRTFAFAAGVGAAACLLFGLAPAIRATATSPGESIKARGVTSRERFGVRRALVVLQVALSLVLVLGALLFARSLRNLTTSDAGFRQDGIITASLDMRKARIAPDGQAAFNDRLLESIRAIAGVTTATQVFTTPVGGNFWNERIVIGGALQQGVVNVNSVGPGYFDALGIRIMSGRDFDARDTPESPHVGVVSEAFVKKFMPGRDPLGQTFRFETLPGQPERVVQIVGVSADTKYASLREPFEPLIHLDAEQTAKPDPFMQIAIRSRTSLSALTPAVTRAIANASPAITIQYQTLESLVQQSLVRDRLMATLSGFFGALAVLIATIGLYGVMSYMVARRRTEIGVRMALGADRAGVILLVVREASVLLAAGLAIGVGLSLFAARSASAFLYQLTPGDPATIAMAITALGTAALLAAWIPARRASRLSPTEALRE